MAVKTTGAEFKRFYGDDTFWPDGVWHEDALISIEGVDQEILDVTAIADDAKVVIEGGMVFGPEWEGNEPSMETFFKRWKKKQTTTCFLVECDIAKLDAVKAAIRAAGGKAI